MKPAPPDGWVNSMDDSEIPKEIQKVVTQEFSKWESGLCDCWNDKDSCLLAICCPCLLFGFAKQLAGESLSGNFLGCMLGGCPTIMLCALRENIRVQYNIEGNCIEDFGCSCLCSLCALTQIYRQLKRVPLSKKAIVHPEWSSGLFDCCVDIPAILLVSLCFCLAYGVVKKKTGHSKLGHCICGLMCLNPIVNGCQNRGFLRAKYGIQSGQMDNFVSDFLVWLVFPCCALSQELRHVKKFPILVNASDQ
uniref:Uncharacterized protein n=3 Tax=Cryptomonas curvata TaxID=233186 RepID=A0A7S0ME34_9CRYP|mmetsp:Transcript_36892/g.77050  ORF Transcript_36892/g.77050 Transcript_36892/m.77050 type:complete len:249 (+) Transcript_36892:3-749(+)